MAGKPILVVDDDPLNLEIIKEYLEIYDHQILTFDNGRAGLDYLETNSDVAVVLLDRMMPGLSGDEVCRLIKTSPKTRHIPVIFVSARATADDLLATTEIGADDYLAKPFVEQDLITTLSRHLTLSL